MDKSIRKIGKISNSQSLKSDIDANSDDLNSKKSFIKCDPKTGVALSDDGWYFMWQLKSTSNQPNSIILITFLKQISSRIYPLPNYTILRHVKLLITWLPYLSQHLNRKSEGILKKGEKIQKRTKKIQDWQKLPCSQKMKVSCRPNFGGSNSPWNNSEHEHYCCCHPTSSCQIVHDLTMSISDMGPMLRTYALMQCIYV